MAGPATVGLAVAAAVVRLEDLAAVSEPLPDPPPQPASANANAAARVPTLPVQSLILGVSVTGQWA